MTFRLACRALFTRPLVFCVAAFLFAVAVVLFLGAAVVPRALEESLSASAQDFDGVLGPRSSKAQLVLSSIYHIDNPVGTVPVTELERIRKHPSVAEVFPVVMGDNYQGFRLLGTETAFARLYQDSDDAVVSLDGDWHHPKAVVGSYVAKVTGLRVGDHFAPAHGLIDHGDHTHETEFEVAAVLEPQGQAVDRLILVPLRALQELDGHRESAKDELSAILLKLKPGAQMMAMQLERNYNRAGGSYTLAWPVSRVVAELMESFRWVPQLVRLLSIAFALIAVCALFGIVLQLVEIQRPLLLQLRSFGASRRQAVGFVLSQAGLLLLAGYVVGTLGFLLLGSWLSGWLIAEHGVQIEFVPSFGAIGFAFAAAVGLAGVSILWPVWQSYRLDLSAQLQDFDL